jgi:hypothetical protein
MLTQQNIDERKQKAKKKRTSFFAKKQHGFVFIFDVELKRDEYNNI